MPVESAGCPSIELVALPVLPLWCDLGFCSLQVVGKKKLRRISAFKFQYAGDCCPRGAFTTTKKLSTATVTD